MCSSSVQVMGPEDLVTRGLPEPTSALVHGVTVPASIACAALLADAKQVQGHHEARSGNEHLQLQRQRVQRAPGAHLGGQPIEL